MNFYIFYFVGFYWLFFSIAVTKTNLIFDDNDDDINGDHHQTINTARIFVKHVLTLINLEFQILKYFIKNSYCQAGRLAVVVVELKVELKLETCHN